MPFDFSILADKNISLALQDIYSMLADTSLGIKEKGVKPRWEDKNYLIEQGFFIDNLDKKASIFFWYLALILGLHGFSALHLLRRRFRQ
jgi:hypothetical protein